VEDIVDLIEPLLEGLLSLRSWHRARVVKKLILSLERLFGVLLYVASK
jgi:hypothetical protein